MKLLEKVGPAIFGADVWKAAMDDFRTAFTGFGDKSALNVESKPRQGEIWFFKPWQSGPSQDEINGYLNHPEFPLASVIGNAGQVARLRGYISSAYTRHNHVCPINLLMEGSSGAGKTHTAKMFAKAIGLPFIVVEAQSKATSSTQAFTEYVNRELRKVQDNLAMVPMLVDENDPAKGHYYEIPPCVIFFDEAHNLPKAFQQSLLPATERKDARYITSQSTELVRTYNVTFILATTESDKLFHALRRRFNVKLRFETYSLEEIAQIVGMATDASGNPFNFPLEVCLLAARYSGHQTRSAINFAEELVDLAKQFPHVPFNELAVEVASRQGIDEHGMPMVYLHILNILSDGPVAAKNIVHAVPGYSKDELLSEILPAMMWMPDAPSLISIGSRGYEITEAGLTELEKRTHAT